MIYTIQNRCLTVQIEDLGAQLASIRDSQGREFLWQGSPASWPRRAPILFPVIGRLREGTYLLNGEPYQITNHGFARDCLFEVLGAEGGEALSFRLTDSPETRRVYPFSFALTVSYRLEENSLEKAVTVENRSEEELLYELGAHDGFLACTRADSIQVFRKKPGDVEELSLYGMNEESMLTPKDREVSSYLLLTPMTYDRDTIIFDNPGCARLSTGRGEVTIQAPDFPYMGVWTPDLEFDPGFVCIEPWSSLPDGVFMGRELGEKPGIRRLAPGTSETLRYTTIISPA